MCYFDASFWYKGHRSPRRGSSPFHDLERLAQVLGQLFDLQSLALRLVHLEDVAFDGLWPETLLKRKPDLDRLPYQKQTGMYIRVVHNKNTKNFASTAFLKFAASYFLFSVPKFAEVS